MGLVRFIFVVGCLCGQGLLLNGFPHATSKNAEKEVIPLLNEHIEEVLMKHELEKLKSDPIAPPKLLGLDVNRENIDLHFEDAKNFSPSICANISKPSFAPPFPAFVVPYMTILASQYPEWRSQIPHEIECAMHELESVDLHPCPHENSSCVVISLPNNHLFFGCMNDKTGELVAPKGFDKDSEKFLIDFRVPSPFKINRECKADLSGKPICQRVNIFNNDRIISEDASCCCKGDFCADVLFDQHGFNPAPYLHVEVDESNVSSIPDPNRLSVPDIKDHKKLSLQDSSQVAEAGFDWSFSPIETIIIACVVLIIVIIVISMGLWFVYEREKSDEKIKQDTIESHAHVFDEVTQGPFTIQSKGKRIL